MMDGSCTLVFKKGLVFNSEVPLPDCATCKARRAKVVSNPLSTDDIDNPGYVIFFASFLFFFIMILAIFFLDLKDKLQVKKQNEIFVVLIYFHVKIYQSFLRWPRLMKPVHK